MKRISLLLVAFLLPVSAMAADPAKDATDKAQSWLALVDAGNYSESWNEASKYFEGHVTAAQWSDAAKAARVPLGALASRTATNTRLASTLPGAPNGEYVVISFHTKFAHKAEALETVTMMMEAGTWKLAGYFIK